MHPREPALQSGDRTRADGILQLCAFLGGRAITAQCVLQEAGWGEHLSCLDWARDRAWSPGSRLGGSQNISQGQARPAWWGGFTL